MRRLTQFTQPRLRPREARLGLPHPVVRIVQRGDVAARSLADLGTHAEPIGGVDRLLQRPYSVGMGVVGRADERGGVGDGARIWGWVCGVRCRWRHGLSLAGASARPRGGVRGRGAGRSRGLDRVRGWIAAACAVARTPLFRHVVVDDRGWDGGPGGGRHERRRHHGRRQLRGVRVGNGVRVRGRVGVHALPRLSRNGGIGCSGYHRGRRRFGPSCSGRLRLRRFQVVVLRRGFGAVAAAVRHDGRCGSATAAGDGGDGRAGWAGRTTGGSQGSSAARAPRPLAA